MTALAYDYQMATSRTIVALALVACAIAIAACESDDDSEATATTVPTAVTAPTTEKSATAEAPSTTEGAAAATPATTEASATAETSSDENLAVVWGSSADSNRVNTELPQPQWVVGETTVALDIVGIVGNDPTAEEFGASCQEWVELLNTDDEHCMFVQFRFDVSSNATERGGIFVPHVITAEGEQIDLFFSNAAWPDTVDSLLAFVVPGAGTGPFELQGSREWPPVTTWVDENRGLST